MDKISTSDHEKAGSTHLLPSRSSVLYTWGTTPAEQRMTYPCDDLSRSFDESYYRGVTVWASRKTLFRWLCQMRIAPYSYDWIDNFGRASPRFLYPGVDDLAAGQTFMTIFRLVDYQTHRFLTLRIKRKIHSFKLFGDVIVCYLILPVNKDHCRLLVKLLVRYPEGVPGALMKKLLPLGDLVMMRRQLLNFKQLAEMQS